MLTLPTELKSWPSLPSLMVILTRQPSTMNYMHILIELFFGKLHLSPKSCLVSANLDHSLNCVAEYGHSIPK